MSHYYAVFLDENRSKGTVYHINPTDIPFLEKKTSIQLPMPRILEIKHALELAVRYPGPVRFPRQRMAIVRGNLEHESYNWDQLPKFLPEVELYHVDIPEGGVPPVMLPAGFIYGFEVYMNRPADLVMPLPCFVPNASYVLNLANFMLLTPERKDAVVAAINRAYALEDSVTFDNAGIAIGVVRDPSLVPAYVILEDNTGLRTMQAFNAIFPLAQHVVAFARTLAEAELYVAKNSLPLFAHRETLIVQ